MISGGVDIESGGLISLYGQILRLDRAQLTFSGLAGVAPELDLQTTSTLEDPTVGRGRDDLSTDPIALGTAGALAVGFGAAAIVTAIGFAVGGAVSETPQVCWVPSSRPSCLRWK